MANTLYDKARYRFATGSINWLTDTFKVLLVDTGAYTPNFSAHEYLSDIGESARNFGDAGVAGVAITNPTVESNGAVDGSDVTFTNVSGTTIEAVVIYKDVSGTPASSPLIAYLDTATGLPITPNGGNIIVTWDNGVNRIFRL
jgi:hypothetical protein